MNNWKIFKGLGKESPDDNPLQNLPEPPPWRDFSTWKERRGRVLRLGENEQTMINAALYLRRPLLVTGPPGCGKSSIAYAVATELKLGEVLRWSVNSRSTLREGLYEYDAIARLRDANLEQQLRSNLREPGADTEKLNNALAELDPNDIGRYIRLGPLGTALLPRKYPSVLLIDEIDKADIDLPNDLLHVLEEGGYEIPELSRIAKQRESVSVATQRQINQQATENKAKTLEIEPVTIEKGQVQCEAFPYIVISDNGERELPPTFLRRCLRLELTLTHESDELLKIIENHLDTVPSDSREKMVWLIDKFINQSAESQLAIDQLLNAAFLILTGKLPSDLEREKIVKAVLHDLGK